VFNNQSGVLHIALFATKDHERASLNVQKVEAAQRMCKAARGGGDPD
jgi:hypothetical protein